MKVHFPTRTSLPNALACLLLALYAVSAPAQDTSTVADEECLPLAERFPDLFGLPSKYSWGISNGRSSATLQTNDPYWSQPPASSIAALAAELEPHAGAVHGVVDRPAR
jgi:hypothetical protein